MHEGAEEFKFYIDVDGLSLSFPGRLREMGIHPVVNGIEFAEFVFEDGVEECSFSVGSKRGKKRKGNEEEKDKKNQRVNGWMDR